MLWVLLVIAKGRVIPLTSPQTCDRPTTGPVEQPVAWTTETIAVTGRGELAWPGGKALGW